jgi:hypothetical protein
MKKSGIVVDKAAVLGTAAGVVTEEKGGLRPARGTTAKILSKVEK